MFTWPLAGSFETKFAKISLQRTKNESITLQAEMEHS